MKYLFIIWLLFFSSTSYSDDIESAVVKIYSVFSKPNYYEPWKLNSSQSKSGSGVIIKGNRILTNAHVVSDNKFLQIRKRSEAKKYIAKVEFVSHDYDLALLKVEDTSFFYETKHADFGELPMLRDKVITLGYPIGGDILSITEGVVSRIEHTIYSHSGRYLLSCQTDASINPGNSGGPVLKNNKIVGIAFQGGGGDNIGYFIPTSIIKHFLNDIKDGSYDGMPSIGIMFQTMENQYLKDYYGLNNNTSGVIISNIFQKSSAHGILKENDILTKIDNYTIEIDGTIEFRKGERTSLIYAIQNKNIKDLIKIRVIRDKKPLELTLELKPKKEVKQPAPRITYDKKPTYFIYSGLVFQPLSENLLKIWGKNWRKRAPYYLLNYFYDSYKFLEYENFPVLVKVLSDKCNVGYENMSSSVITKVNNKKIFSIKELAKEIKNSKNNYIVLTDDSNNKIVLNKKEADKSNYKIKEKYMVTEMMSEDIKNFLK